MNKLWQRISRNILNDIAWCQWVLSDFHTCKNRSRVSTVTPDRCHWMYFFLLPTAKFHKITLILHHTSNKINSITIGLKKSYCTLYHNVGLTRTPFWRKYFVYHRWDPLPFQWDKPNDCTLYRWSMAGSMHINSLAQSSDGYCRFKEGQRGQNSPGSQ